MANKQGQDNGIEAALKEFESQFRPLEAPAPDAESKLLVLTDGRTGARYCECHVRAKELVTFGTVDVPLDLEQAEYRANREIVEDAYAFEQMKADAKQRRSFSNIVAEYTKEVDPDSPLKIIGGQHRFEAIREALASGVDEYHGVKVYFGLDMEQRLDVQLVSNTNIATSTALFDRMHETVKGPELRDWCQRMGLLDTGRDFADRQERGGPISVQMARTFITNFYLGQKIDPRKFDSADTTPVLCPSGQLDREWDKLRDSTPNLWTDPELQKAASQFASLVKAQRAAFSGKKPKPQPDYPEKAMNAAILAAWAYVAGIQHKNEVRLKRHFGLAIATGRDPLNAAGLAKGRHKTDPDNYRGLGYRTDAKERGRFVELFNLQAEEGSGITTSTCWWSSIGLPIELLIDRVQRPDGTARADLDASTHTGTVRRV